MVTNQALVPLNHSPLRVDPRTALYVVLVMTATAVANPSPLQIFLMLCLAGYLGSQGLKRKGIKHFLVYLVLYGCAYSIHTYDIQSAKTLQFLLFFLVRLFPILTSVTVVSTFSPGELAAAFSKMRFPRSVVLPFIVMLRFVPTLRMEFRQILDAMHLRQLSFRSGYGVRHPFRTLRNILVPLLFRCLQIADELGASGTSRGIDAPCERTVIRSLKLTAADWGFAILLTSCALLFLFWRITAFSIPLGM